MISNSSNPMDILKSEKKKKKKKEKLYIKRTSTAATTEFVRKSLNRKKISNEHFNLCETEILLDEIIKSIAPVLLDVYDSWGKLDTMSVTYRTRIISAIYKR